MATDEEQERLLRALRASGSDAELADEERYRAMFRAERGDSAPVVALRSRAPRRVVVGGAAAALIALGTGGVAAAYTGNLPDPVQRLAHHVIGAPAAPPPEPTTAAPAPSTSAGPRHTPTARGTASPSDRPTHHDTHGPRRSGSASPTPSSSPTATPSPSAVPSVTATAPAPVLTGLMVVGTSHRADVGARVTFSGQLTWSGDDVPGDQRVVLQQRVGSRWSPVARGQADATGAVTLTAPPLLATTGFRLRAGSVHSVVWRVAMHPLLTATSTAKGRTATITVDAQGASAGDVVTLVTRRDGRQVIVGQTRLDDDGTGSITVRPGQRRTPYGVVLAPTRQHTSARTGVVVTLPRTKG